jgi:hypothetical protein
VAAGRAGIEGLVELSDVVKVSDEDLRWLYPGERDEDMARRWLATGPVQGEQTKEPAFGLDAWWIEPARIGIMGFSAGGHLASTAGTHFDDGDPKAPVTLQTTPGMGRQATNRRRSTALENRTYVLRSIGCGTSRVQRRLNHGRAMIECCKPKTAINPLRKPCSMGSG